MSNTLHNAIMEAGSKDRPPMLAPGNYVQWKSRIKRYIDTKLNHELIYYCLENNPYKLDWQDIHVPISKGSPITTYERIRETYKNVSQDIRDQLNAEAEAVQIILTGIDNDIYLTVDDCSNACEMWKAIERLKQVQSNQSSSECSVPASTTTRMAKNSLTKSQQATTRNKGKAIVNSPQPIYDQEPSMVDEDDETSKDKEIDKLMTLISLSIAGYENQRNGIVAGARETIGSTVVHKSGIQCYNCKEFGHVARECQKPKRIKDATYHKEKMLLCKQEEAGIQLNVEQADWRDDTDDDELEDQELEAHYMYMAQLQQVSPDAADSGPIFDDEPLQKVSNDDHHNVFAIERTHPEQSESVLDTYPIEQDAQNVIIDSLDMSDDREEIDQNDDDNDLAKERELLASLIEKFKCEIDERKNRNKFLETSNKALIDKLKGVILTTSVSRPQLKSNPQGDRVMHNNSQRKKPKVDDHHRSVKLSKNKMSVTACNDSLNAKTLNVNSVCATCDKCVLHDKHDMCVLKSVAKPIKRTVASESNTKPRNFTRKLYVRVSKTCSWWYPKFTPSGYKWKPKSRKDNANPNLVEIVLFIVDSGCSKHMTGNLKLLINFVEKFLGTVKFGNDQITPILGYGDLVQGAVTIKRVYYVEGLNNNLFSISQFYDADLEVAFRKSTCFIRDLKGNDLLTGSRSTDLYSITLQDTNSPNLICLMAKASSSQAWLWHRRLSHLNFDTINLLSKNDIVVGLPKLKFVKDHLCSSCEMGKAKRKSLHTKLTPSSKRRLQLLHMDLCGPMRVASTNGKRYMLVIVDDYSMMTYSSTSGHEPDPRILPIPKPITNGP
nr:hypothetical protein [Tanacetum cinerariifolium]